jgi:hypothetical protein
MAVMVVSAFGAARQTPMPFREFSGFAGALSIRPRMDWNAPEEPNPNGGMALI